MIKSKKNFAIVLVITIFLALFGSLFAVSDVFTKPTKTVKAVETRAPGLYNGSNFTSWDDLISSGKISVDAGHLQVTNSGKDMAGELVCGSVDGLTNLSQTFFNCAQLTSIIFTEDFDTSNVTDMSLMFYGCSELQSLDLKNFDTSAVTTDIDNLWYGMGMMFAGCSSLKELDLSSFNTSGLYGIDGMFLCCFSLESLKLSDTFHRYGGNLFAGCANLKELSLKNLNASSYILCGSSIDKLTFDQNFIIDNSSNNIFYSFQLYLAQNEELSDEQKSKLLQETNPIARLDLLYEFIGKTKIDNSDAFYYYLVSMCCDSVIKTIVCPQVASDVTIALAPANGYYYSYDNGKTKVTELSTATNGKTLQLYKNEVLTRQTGLFRNGKQIKTWDDLLADGDIAITNGALQVVNKDLEGDLVCGDVSGLTSLAMAFINCSKLTSLDLSRLNTSGVTEMNGAFMGCSFKILNMSGKFVIPSGCETGMMFCSPDMFLADADIKAGSTEYTDIMKEHAPRARLSKLAELMGASIKDLEADQEIYAQCIAFLSDSTICEIILPTSVSGVIALAPMSGQHYAYTSTSEAIDKLEASSGSNTKLTLYKDATSADAEAEPVPFPTTPSGTSETGVVANVSMVVIALVSVIGLAVVLTKKKRMAR